jgi:hypothetical protein
MGWCDVKKSMQPHEKEATTVHNGNPDYMEGSWNDEDRQNEFPHPWADIDAAARHHGK